MFGFEDALASSKLVLIDILKLNASKINYLKLKSSSLSDGYFKMVINNIKPKSIGYLY